MWIARREGGRHPRIAWAAVAALALVAGLTLWALSGWTGSREVERVSVLPEQPTAPVRLRIAYSVPAEVPNGAVSRVVIADPDGADGHRIGPGYDPVVAPDGRYVAYGIGRASAAQVRIVELGSASPVSWTVPLRGTGTAVWAPDSSQIAVAGGSARQGGTYVVPAHPGGRPRLVTHRFGSGLTFSPDGTRLMFQVSGGAVVTVATAGGPLHTVVPAGQFVRAAIWTRLGIVYADGRDLWIVQPDGSGRRRLTHTGAGLVPIAASADGTHLLAEFPPSNNGRLWAVDVSSGRTRPLTGWEGDLNGLSISRNGRTVLAATGCGEVFGAPGVVFSKPFAGGRARIIARGPCVATWND